LYYGARNMHLAASLPQTSGRVPCAAGSAPVARHATRSGTVAPWTATASSRAFPARRSRASVRPSAVADSHVTAEGAAASDENAVRPLRLLVAGGGIGGLVLAKGAPRRSSHHTQCR